MQVRCLVWRTAVQGRMEALVVVKAFDIREEVALAPQPRDLGGLIATLFCFPNRAI